MSEDAAVRLALYCLGGMLGAGWPRHYTDWHKWRWAMNEAVVIRTWKRDGSTNAMAVDVAAENLRQNGADDVRGQPAHVIADRLRQGEVLLTPLAVFSIRHGMRRAI